MPTTQFPKVPSPPSNPDLSSLAKYVGDVANLLAVLSKELDYLLNGSLDVQNIRAHSITADTLNVDELSAITANLGTITAGIINGIQIFGSYIATANGTYPRAEMSTTDNLFGAYLDGNNFLEVQPSDPGTSAPTISWTSSGSTASQLYADASEMRLRAIGRNMVFETFSSGNIDFQPEVGNSVTFPSLFAMLAGGTDFQTLFDAKANGSGVSGTVYVASSSGGPVTTPITFSNGVRTS